MALTKTKKLKSEQKNKTKKSNKSNFMIFCIIICILGQTLYQIKIFLNLRKIQPEKKN